MDFSELFGIHFYHLPVVRQVTIDLNFRIGGLSIDNTRKAALDPGFEISLLQVDISLSQRFFGIIFSVAKFYFRIPDLPCQF